jgi:hypothetical protein
MMRLRDPSRRRARTRPGASARPAAPAPPPRLRAAPALLAASLAVLLAVLLAALLAAALLAACSILPGAREGDEADKRLEPPASDQQSLVFGYLDMTLAPTRLGWMEFRQLSPVTATPFYQMRIHEGVFYMEKFPVGVFTMGEFGGERWDGQHLAYALPRTSPAVRVSIGEPGLHFVGAYRYRPVKEDGSRTGRFEMDALASPSEAEVLERILPFARGTPWEPRILARMAAPPRPQ